MSRWGREYEIYVVAAGEEMLEAKNCYCQCRSCTYIHTEKERVVFAFHRITLRYRITN